MDQMDWSGDALAQCQALCRMSEHDDIEKIRNTASGLVQYCCAYPKSEGVMDLWKELEDRDTNLLQSLLDIFERCYDGQLAVTLVRLLDTFVQQSPKGRKKRIRLVVVLNGVTSILKCFMAFCQQSPADLPTVESLVYLTLLFGGADKRFPVKIRLTGALKAATDLCRTHSVYCLFDFLIAAAQSPQNGLFLGKNKDTIPYLLALIRSTMDQEMDLCGRALELTYCLAKLRKNRTRLAAENCIDLLLDLFKCYFQSENESAEKLCLFTLATLRLMTRTKSGQHALLDCNGLEIFRDAVKRCMRQLEENGEPADSNDLIEAICAVCLRCLPAKRLPDDLFENPLKFALPVDGDRRPPEERTDSEEDNNEAGASEAEEETSTDDDPLQKRERRKAADLEREYGQYCTEFDSGSIPALLLRPLRSIVTFDQTATAGSLRTSDPESSSTSPILANIASASTNRIHCTRKPVGELRTNRRRSLSVGDLCIRNSQKTRGCSRLRMRTEAACPKLAPLTKAVRTMSLGDAPRWKPRKPLDYTPDEYAKNAVETKSVKPFCKIAYPEFIGGYPNLPLQPLKDTSAALLERVLLEIEKGLSSKPFNQRTVFDLAVLLEQPREDGLTNNDIHRIGRPYANSDHLKFESRFESGNLRKAVQVGPFEYELFMNSDINQLHLHYQWFYFEVSNMVADVPYTFTIANCVKSQSLFQIGMQPVVFSVSEAVAGRPGWARCGRTVVYYKNRYTRQGKKQNDARSYYNASFTVSFRHAYDVCYFAYHYPYTYTMLKTHLSKLQESMSNRRDIYMRRDVLCHSLGGNPVDVITVTGNAKGSVIAKRDCVVLTARVHPGETNASWMMHGSIDFLLSDHAKAKEAREKYVFKLIPMLNPDGVINGNHRCSLAGQDLNRQWAKPSSVFHPTIYHAKGLLQYLHSINKAPFVYCDYHGHSRKKNIFLYGNNPQLSWWPPDHALLHHYQFYALPEILDKLAPGFWLKYSSFIIQKDKEPSARVAVWREMGIWRSYTMEASFGGFDSGPYQGYQIGTHQCIEMGQKLCEALIVLRDHVAGKQSPSRKYEESDEDTELPPKWSPRQARNYSQSYKR